MAMTGWSAVSLMPPTARSATLACLPSSTTPNRPALTCVEEIDHGLHPQALELLVERFREASERGQYIVATHSPALVDRLRAVEFVVSAAQSGQSPGRGGTARSYRRRGLRDEKD